MVVNCPFIARCIAANPASMARIGYREIWGHADAEVNRLRSGDEVAYLEYVRV